MSETKAIELSDVALVPSANLAVTAGFTFASDVSDTSEPTTVLESSETVIIADSPLSLAAPTLPKSTSSDNTTTPNKPDTASTNCGQAKTPQELYDLGWKYLNGKGVKTDVKQAMENFRQAADLGHSDAQYRLACLYLKGDDREAADEKQAEFYFEKAAKQNNAAAAWYLGYMFFRTRKDEAIEYLFNGAESGGVLSDRERCLKLLENELGDELQAQYYIGLCYLNGFGTKVHDRKAVSWFLKVADQGNAKAQYLLANCYYEGKGVEKDFVQATAWYQEAAKKGEFNALFKLGSMHHDGENVLENTIKAADLMFIVAEKCEDEALKKKAFNYLTKKLDNNSNAKFYIGKCHHGGFGTQKNTIEAMKWYTQAAEQGYSEALREIGFVYFEKKDYDAAAKSWFEGACAPRNIPLNEQCFALLLDKLSKCPISQFYIGECFMKSFGTRVSVEKGVEWYRKAANQECAEAQNALGTCYMNSKGVKRDVNEALRLWNKAAEHKDAGALFNLGVCFLYGLAGGRSEEKAFEYYSKAADLGHSRAQCSLGELYFNGYGVEQDYEKAFGWFRKAADQDNAEAQFNVGLCLQLGYGVKVDNNESANWYRKAANLGYAKAQNNLGDCYENGRGVEKNLDKALEWYHRAAQQGEAIAFVGLGDCYYKQEKYSNAAYYYLIACEKNFEIDPVRIGDCYFKSQVGYLDYKEAMKWYRKAAEKDNAEAMYKLSNCYKLGHGVEKDSAEAYKWLNAAASRNYTQAQHDLRKLSEGILQKPEALELHHRAFDQSPASVQKTFNTEGDTEPMADETKKVSKHREETEDNSAISNNTSANAQSDSMELKNTGVLRESVDKNEKSPSTVMPQKVILLDSYVTDSSKVMNTGSVHSSLILQVSTSTEDEESFVAKVFPPVKAKEWNCNSDAETRCDLDSSLTEPMRRFLTERYNLRELAKKEDKGKFYYVPMVSFGSIEYEKLLLAAPNWIKKCLDEEKLSEEDKLVFPVIVMEKMSSNFSIDIRRFINSISFLREPDLSPSIYRIIGRLLDCLAYLHSRNLVWCDCKPSNFVKKPGSEGFIDSIAMIDLDGCVQANSPVIKGTALFTPPESGGNDLRAAPSYDIWSLGVTLLILFSRIANRSLKAAMDETVPNKKPSDIVLEVMKDSNVKNELNELGVNLHRYLQSMLCEDPLERPTAADLSCSVSRLYSVEVSNVKLDEIFTMLSTLKGSADALQLGLEYIAKSVDLLYQDESKQLPRYYFSTWTGSCLFYDRYKFQLLCDGAWVFEEINAEGKNDIACECSEFKVKIPNTTYNKFAPALFKVLSVARTCLAVLSHMSPNQTFSKALSILKMGAESASQAYDRMKENAKLENLTLSDDKEIVEDSFKTMFKFLSGRGFWDGKNNTGPFERMIYTPTSKGGKKCHVFLCNEHAKVARNLEHFKRVDGGGFRGSPNTKRKESN